MQVRFQHAPVPPRDQYRQSGGILGRIRTHYLPLTFPVFSDLVVTQNFHNLLRYVYLLGSFSVEQSLLGGVALTGVVM